MTSRSYFGKMNSTLGSVVPLVFLIWYSPFPILPAICNSSKADVASCSNFPPNAARIKSHFHQNWLKANFTRNAKVLLLENVKSSLIVIHEKSQADRRQRAKDTVTKEGINMKRQL